MAKKYISKQLVYYQGKQLPIGTISDLKKIPIKTRKELCKAGWIELYFPAEEEENEEVPFKIYTVIKKDKVRLKGKTDFLAEGHTLDDELEYERTINQMLNSNWIIKG